MPIEQESNIIYAMLPLIAVVIGGMLAWIPLFLRSKHDSKEREKERQMSLRRDVYLFAAEKIGQQLSYLANFYQTKDASPTGYDEAITKIDIIGSKETIAALNQFNDHMVEAYYELITKKNEIDLLEVSHRYLTEGLKNGTLEPQKSIKEFKNIYNKKIKLTCELAGKCQQKTQSVEKLLTSVIVAIRKEMNTPFDEAAYRAMMKISQNKWKENVKKFIASLKDQYTQELRLIDQMVQESGI